jgi:hypothetical protein
LGTFGRRAANACMRRAGRALRLFLALGLRCGGAAGAVSGFVRRLVFVSGLRPRKTDDARQAGGDECRAHGYPSHDHESNRHQAFKFRQESVKEFADV